MKLTHTRLHTRFAKSTQKGPKGKQTLRLLLLASALLGGFALFAMPSARPALAALAQQAATLTGPQNQIGKIFATTAKRLTARMGTGVSAPAAGIISGTVFRDWNGDGNQGPATAVRIPEPGISGVTITAYNAAGAAVGTATSGADGTYSLTTSDAGTGPYRVEFTNIPAGLSYGPAGATSGTAVQFVATTPRGGVSLGLNEPKDYCQDNPFLGIPCYISGDPSKAGTAAGGDVFVVFPYSAGSSAPYDGFTVPVDGNQPMPSKPAKAAQIGATWGVSYQRATRKVLTSAVVRRHSGFGPLGIGGIYVITNPGDASAGVANFVDVKTLGIDVGTLTNATRNLPGDATASSADAAAFTGVGKSGIGDLEISEDGKTLWLINLNDRKLYSIFINDPLVTPTAANVSSFTVPSPNCTGGVFRPWAIKPYRGKVYVGGTCTAETSQNASDLKAAIYEFTPGANTFVSRLEFGLNFTRGIIWNFAGVPVRNQWRPWTDDFNTLIAFDNGIRKFQMYPQPVLSGLEFDLDGSMIIGFMDRTGMQTGYLQADLSGNNPVHEGISGGDTMRAFNNNGTFVLENNGVVGGRTGGKDNGQGPGNCSNNSPLGCGEFYFQENFTQIENGQPVQRHQETSLGAVGLLVGALQVVIPVFDPFTIRSGGVLLMNNFDGKTDRRYEIFPQPTTEDQRNGLFGKAAGLGDLEVLCDAAPLEIGNRIWNDLNRNGIQDANEPGRPGVTVLLFKGGQQVGTATTDANGQFLFTGDPNAPNSSSVGKVAGGILPNMAYEIRVAKAQAALVSTSLSPNDTDNTANGDQRDSDAVMSGGNAVITLTTGATGANDHSFDLGFFDERVDLSLTKAVSAGPYAPNQNITYTLVVSNATDCTKAGEFAGPCSTATNVTVSDAFPAQLTFVSANPAAAYNSVTNVWAVGTLAPGASATLTITATIKTGTIGSVRNFAQVQTQDGPKDIDSTPGNRNPSSTPTEDDEAEVTINVQSASLGDRVFIDKNGNGCQDAGEVGLQGVTVMLLDANGATLDTKTTDANGNYLFSNLAGATYSVKFTAPAGYVFTKRAVAVCGGAGDSDADPATGRTQNVTLSPGQNFLDLDAGLYQPALLGDCVWNDMNRDGIYDPNTEVGVPGVTVTLFDANNAQVTTTTTNASGKYSFGNLAPGNYSVGFSNLPQGFVFSPRDVGNNDAVDSDADPATGRTAQVMLMSGQSYLDLDAGIYPRIDLSLTKSVSAPPHITGQNVTFTLTVSNAAGLAQATNVSVKDVLPAGLTFVSANPAAAYNSGTAIWTVGTLNSGSSATLQITATISATNGTINNCAQVQTAKELDVDSTPGNFGSAPAEDDEACASITVQSASLGDFVWHDLNANGCQDPGEPGVPGVVVTLFNGSNTQLGTTTTDANGRYSFINLAPGDYYVVFGLPNTYGFTVPKAAACGDTRDSDANAATGRSQTITLSGNQNFPDLDAGLIQRACVSGFVYVDVNDDGVKDATEAPIKDVTVTLTGTDAFGNVVSQSVVTDANGFYQFCNLVPGTYKLTETQPPTFIDGKDTVGSLGGTVTNDMFSTVVLGSGANGVNYNFGEKLSFDLALRKDHLGNFQPNDTGSYQLTVTNNGPGASQGTITVVDDLPGGITYQSFTGTGWSCSAGAGSSIVTCTYNNSLAAGASTTVTLRVRIAQSVQCAVVNVATLTAAGDTNQRNNVARDTTLIDNCTMQMTMDPGTSSLDPGSILVYPVYTSDASNPNRENTKICLTNTNQKKPIAVHLFFVDGTTCSVSDSFLCLTQNQTACFLTSDIDPGTMGYIVAVAVDDQGCPINFNWLIGDESIKFAAGHQDSLVAESFPWVNQALANPACVPGQPTATLNLNGTDYRRPGRTLAASSILSRVDSNSTLIVIDRVGGSLTTAAGTIGNIFGILYDDGETPFSFNIASPNCQIKQVLSDSFPRTTPRFTQVIPAGRTGWMKFAAQTDIGIIGAVFNFNPNSASVGGAFTGGRGMHKLTLGQDAFVIPVFPPSC